LPAITGIITITPLVRGGLTRNQVKLEVKFN